MSWLHAVRHRAVVLLRGRAYAREVEEEMRFHLELETMHQQHDGLRHDDAAHAAQRKFGSRAYHAEDVRRAGGWSLLDTAVQDARIAFRGLRRTPGFAAVAILTLAFGIGANATVYSWLDGLVMHPFPAVQEPDRLVSIVTLTPEAPRKTASYPEYVAWREQATTIQGLAAYQMYQFGLQDAAATSAAEPIWGVFASGNYFQTLGVRTTLGRAFVPDDSLPGATPVVVISHGLWRQHFAGDSAVVGRRVRLNGRDVEIVGVAPPNFTGSFAGLGFDAWVPLTAYPQLGDFAEKLRATGSYWLTVFGRLAPAVSIEQARAEVAAIGKRLSPDKPLDQRTSGLGLVAFEGGNARAILRPLFVAMLAITTLVLLIVCANLANLLLSRATARQHEMGVRMALGAGRARLVRQLLVESAVLAFPGALLGLAFAWWGRGALSALVPTTALPLDLETRLDARVVAFVIVVTMAATLLLGIAPALRLSSRSLSASLRSGARGVSHARPRLRGIFVVVQVALSLVALASAALFMRTLTALRHVDPGFRGPEHVLLVPTDFGFAGTRDPRSMRASVDRIIDRVKTLPGVTAAAFGDWVPMGVESPDTWTTTVPGHVPQPGESNSVSANHVTPEYFAAMGVPLLRGRAFRDADRSDSSMVVIVNEAFVRQFFDGREALGQAINVGMAAKPNATIVGVVKDGVYDTNRMRDPTPTFMYVPYAQASPRAVTLHVRTAGDPATVVAAVRREIADVAPALPVLAPGTLDERVRTAFFLQRIGSAVLGALGAVALVLSALGLYGVVAYAVAQRIREVGIRMALGARSGQVISVFVEYGLKLTFLGVALGMVGALWAGRLLSNQLYGVSPGDPVTMGGVAAILALTAVLATWIPARRAARVDPIVAMRTE